MSEDYVDKELIGYAWISLAVFFLSSRIAYGLTNWGEWNDHWLNWLDVWNYQGFALLPGFVSMVVFCVFYAMKKKWRPWSFGEDMLGTILVFMGFLFIGEFWKYYPDYSYLWLVGIMVIGILVHEYFKQRYRSYSWYLSGKKGFSFFATSAVLSGLLLLWSNFYRQGYLLSMLFFTSILICLFGLFVLGGRKIKA